MDFRKVIAAVLVVGLMGGCTSAQEPDDYPSQSQGYANGSDREFQAPDGTWYCAYFDSPSECSGSTAQPVQVDENLEYDEDADDSFNNFFIAWLLVHYSTNSHVQKLKVRNQKHLSSITSRPSYRQPPVRPSVPKWQPAKPPAPAVKPAPAPAAPKPAPKPAKRR